MHPSTTQDDMLVRWKGGRTPSVRKLEDGRSMTVECGLRGWENGAGVRPSHEWPGTTGSCDQQRAGCHGAGTGAAAKTDGCLCALNTI